MLKIVIAPDSKLPFGPDVEKPLGELSDFGRQTVTLTFEGMTKVIGDRDQRISRLEVKLNRLELDLKLREEQLRLARIEKYGPKGEKLSQDQVLLLSTECLSP